MTGAAQPAHDVRAARIDDAPQIAALFRLVYESSSHPCKTEEFVVETLQQPETNIWFVSEHEGQVSGCMGMLHHPWNRSWEIVRGLTHPEFRGGGLATVLAQHALDAAWASKGCDLIVGFPRNRTMMRILSDLVRPGLNVVGHDGGINIAGGRREYHLVGVSFNRNEAIERLVPDRPSAATNTFVQRSVLGPLGLAGVEGLYPPALIAGDHAHHPDYGPFTFEYHPFCPSDSLEITAYTGSKTDPVAIAADLVKTMESFGYARHVRLAVLADKNEFCGALCANGFAMTAYLPAWHLQNGMRYDCLLLTRRTTETEPTDYGTRDVIDYFNHGYFEWSRSISASPRQ
jgi:GNAT superfamily N-acetyltransferase